MKKVVCALIVIGVIVWFLSDGNGSRYDSGYDDGYAVGYNTTCEIRGTLIAGEWGNKHYSRGYADGIVDGIKACIADRRN